MSRALLLENPRVKINQPVSDKVDRDFDFALSSIYDDDSSFAEYGGAVVASGLLSIQQSIFC
jgi:hypothetical protein